MDQVPSSGNEARRSKEYWLGKNYFDYILGQTAKKQHSSIHLDGLDSLQEKLKRQYPYDKVIRGLDDLEIPQLDNKGLHASDQFENLMTALGVILSQGDSAAKQSLIAVLSNQKSEDFLHTLSIEQSEPLQLAGTPDSSIDICRYTSTLKEYGDRSSDLLDYTTNIISLEPPKFEAVLSFGRRTCKAEASTKKLAKHRASKEACGILGLTPM